jgi:tetratricopeptide (TPR) repeat protein
LVDPHTADLDVIAAAGHAVEAGPAADPVEAAELVERAVRLAAGRYGYDVAIRLAEARLTLLARYASSSEQAHADVEVARLRLRAGYGYERAVELLERALSTYLTTGDLEAAGEVHSRLGGALVVPRPGMDVAMSLEHFAAAERLLPQASEMFSLHRGRLSAAMHALDTDSMAAAVDRCSTIADASDRPQLRVAADWGRGWLELDRGRPSAALASLERAWSTASDLGDPLLGWAPSNAGALICTVYLLDPTAGRSWCRRGLGQPRFDTLTHPNDALVDQLVLALATTGELDAARRAAGDLPEAAVGRRLVGFYLGEWEEAAHRWRAALAQDRAAGDRHDAVSNARWLADALLALGDHAGAVEVLSEALEVAAAAPQVPSEVWLRARLATLPDTDLDRAAAHVTRCAEAMSGDEEWRGLAAEVALARSALATRHEDWPAAVGAARDAAAGFAAYRLPWRRVAALRAEAFALVGAGQPDEGRRRMADADAVLTTVGAPDRWRATTSTAPQRPVSTLEP